MSDPQQLPPGIVSIAPGAPTAPLAMPRRIVTLQLPGIYRGFWVKAWANFNRAILDKAQALVQHLDDPDERGLDAEEQAARQAAMDAALAKQATLLSAVLTDHNLVDYDGEPVPPTTDPGFWKFIEGELRVVIFSALAEQVGKLDPKKPGR